MGPEASLKVVAVVVVLGLVAVSGGVFAEITHNQTPPPSSSDGTTGTVLHCAYQRQRARLAALAAASCLTLGHVMITILSGCVCCCSLVYARGTAHAWSMSLFALAWLCFLSAQVCFLSGAFINDYHTSRTFFQYDFDLRECFRTRTYAYYVAAGISLVHTCCLVLGYGQAQKAKYEAWVEQGAPTPRLYSVKTMKSFVIAGPAKKGPLKDLSGADEPFLPPPKR